MSCTKFPVPLVLDADVLIDFAHAETGYVALQAVVRCCKTVSVSLLVLEEVNEPLGPDNIGMRGVEVWEPELERLWEDPERLRRLGTADCSCLILASITSH